MIGNILVGLLIASVGVLLIYGSRFLAETFGSLARAERNIGGTVKMYVLIGFLLNILGLLFVFGVFNTSEMSGNAYDSGFASVQ